MDRASQQARLTTLAQAVHERVEAGKGPTIGDLPHGREIARQMAGLLAAQECGDQTALHLAALRVHTLTRAPRDLDALEYIARQEDAADVFDAPFWECVGGRPTAADLEQHRAREEQARRDRERSLRMPDAWYDAMDALSDRYGLPRTPRPLSQPLSHTAQHDPAQQSTNRASRPDARAQTGPTPHGTAPG